MKSLKLNLNTDKLSRQEHVGPGKSISVKRTDCLIQLRQRLCYYENCNSASDCTNLKKIVTDAHYQIAAIMN